MSRAAKSSYVGHPERWSTYRDVNGQIPYLRLECSAVDNAEESVLNYLALSAWPINKDMLATINHLQVISHFPKNEIRDKPARRNAHVPVNDKGDAARERPRYGEIPFYI